MCVLKNVGELENSSEKGRLMTFLRGDECLRFRLVFS